MGDGPEDEGTEPEQIGGLADAAASALDGEGGDEDQPHLPGTDHAKVKFVGMAWDTLDVPALGEEVTVLVTGMVVGHGEELMADGDKREVAKVKVTSVTRIERTASAD